MLLCPSVSVFTHRVLTPRNIVAQESRISGIIDWETAGSQTTGDMKPSADHDWIRYIVQESLVLISKKISLILFVDAVLESKINKWLQS